MQITECNWDTNRCWEMGGLGMKGNGWVGDEECWFEGGVAFVFVIWNHGMRLRRIFHADVSNAN